MKKRNYVAAILLASLMATSTAIAMPVSAADGSITVSSTVSDGTHNYFAHQILTGDVSDGVMSNIKFGTALGKTATSDGAVSEALAKALKADAVIGAKFASIGENSTANEFAEAIQTLSTDAEKQEFARVIGEHLTGDGTPVGASATTVAEGYYVITEKSSGTDTAQTLNLLYVAGTTEISTKESVPSSEKRVEDKNDSDPTNVALNGNGTSADHDIGDDITYTLTFTLPGDYANYVKYPVEFVDDMCKGLTYNGDAKIWYGEVTGDGADIDFKPDNSIDSAYTGGTVYKATISDLKTAAPSLGAGKQVTIIYTAKLNSDAEIGNPGNPNTYKVNYANNPNWKPNYEDTTTPPEDQTPPPDGETPPSTSVVFTYELIVNKKDENGDALDGAGFTLYKWYPSGTGAVNSGPDGNQGDWNPVAEIKNIDAEDVFEFKGIDDGWYKLEETEVPDKYNKMDDKIFMVDATHNDTGITKLEATGDGITIKGAAADGTLTTDIENQKGITLPETGGIGTVLFYVVGGTLVAGSLVLLITKKRMGEKE